jgi:hypothetical protein
MYNAEISAGALMVVESKLLAKLMLTHPSNDSWKHAIEVENILQKKTPATAKRQAILIKKRLNLVHPDILVAIANGDNELILQFIFVSSLLHSQLHHDFMVKVYGDHLRRYESHITNNAWENFWEECAILDPNINSWSVLTKNKLHQVIIKILCQAKYLDTPRMQALTPPSMRPEVINLVKSHHPQILSGLEFTR